MARHKNENWCLPDGSPKAGGGHTHQWESIHAALLMDIRDELQQLNRTLACPNFLGLPHDIKRLRRTADRLDKRMSKRAPLE